MPDRHARMWREFGPAYLLDVPLEGDGRGTTIDSSYRLDREGTFGRTAPLIVEIGSGAGDMAVAGALAHPEWDFLAFEVWRPGVAHSIVKAAPHGLTNLRFVVADASQALPIMLPAMSVHEIWTFFPDPWPKNKHHKRRLIQSEFASEMGELLEDGGAWRLATDWADYAWQIRDVIEECPTLLNPYAGRLADPGDPQVDPRGEHGGFAPRFPLRPTTRFERRGEAVDRVIRDVVAERVTRQ